MRNLIYLTLALCVLMLCACGNTLEISEFSPNKDVSLSQTFTVKLNNDICPANKQNQWVNDDFMEFEPKIKGKYKWISANTFIFSPDTKLQPIQKYRGHLSENALFNSKELFLGGDDIEFNTPDFNAKNAEFYWANIPNQYYKANIQINLLFNYPVYSDKIRNSIEVKLNGKAQTSYKYNNSQETDKLSLTLENIQQTDKEQDIEIIVKQGAECIHGRKGLDKDISYKYKLPAITQLEISGSASGFDGAKGWLEIAFTQPVNEQEFAKYISFNPTKTAEYLFMENKVRITGNFENSSNITVNIKKGLPGTVGGILQNDFEQDFSFVNLDPSLNFVDRSGKYLKYNGEKTLEVNAVNIDEVEVEVCQIYKNNLLYYLNQNDLSYYDEAYATSAVYPDNYGKTLYRETKLLKNEQNWLEKFQVNLNSTIPNKQKGLYLINVYSTQDRWISASKTLALTDIGIIAKKSGDEIVVFANSIATTEPIAGVEISVISSNNQIILNGHTDGTGVIVFSDVKKKIQDFVPRLITAETAEDFNYIDLDNTAIETSRYDVAGTFENHDNYSAYIYTERDLYRPAETAHISAIIRNKKMEAVQDLPLVVKIISPTEGLFREFNTNVNKEGSFEIAVDFPDYALTGIYRVELYTASGEFINNHIINVEDFVPDKIRVALKPNSEQYKPGEKVSVSIDAEFLFGAKASGLRWSADFHLMQKDFQNAKYNDFSFKGKQSEYPYNQHYYCDGILDNNGKGISEYLIPADAKGSGLLEGYAMVNVFDLNGRSVIKSTRFKVYPNDNFAGIKMKGYYFGTNQNIAAKAILLNKTGDIVQNKPLSVKLIRYEWKTVLKKDYSDKFYYSSEEKQYVEWEKEIQSGSSPKDIKFAVEKSGKYELQVAEKGTDNYSSVEFYAYSWSSSTAGSFEVDKEGRVDILADKELYKVGDKAKLLFTTPFNGRMLVTLERNGVEHYEYIDVENRSAELILDVTDKFLPNIYVSATLFKKHTIDKATPFFVAHGYVSLNVEKPSNKINMQIIAPNAMKPNSTAKITVKTGVPNSYITLSAVDEGILQLYNFKSPDPHKYFYSKKALKTQSYDLYKYLLPEIARTSSSTGGGDMSEADLDAMVKSRSNPIKTKRFKPFSYWSGIIPTNSSGQANFNVEIPNINTEVRLMAVGYQAEKFGAAEKSIKVFNDLIVEPEIPRFLSPNDELIMPVTVINTTNERQTVKLNVYADKAVYLTSNPTAQITIEPNSHNTVEFKLKAKNEIGDGQIKIIASGKSKSEELVDIGVRPSNPFTTTTNAGIIYAGQTVNLQIPDSYYPSLVQANLVVSKLHATNYAGLLKKLIDYPYGCLEQTVSKAFPMLYMGDLAGLIAPNSFRNSNPIFYINEAINKVSSMQKWDGGLSYWENDYQTNYWASIYGAHFLVAAQQAKYQVNQAVLDKLLRYIGKRAKQATTYDYYYYENGKRMNRKIANKEILYSLYVLALAGKADIPTMNYYKARKELLSSDTRYLLAAAFAYSGNLSAFYQLIPNQFEAEWNGRYTGNDFDSYIRSNAIMLSVLVDLDPKSNQIPQIVKFLNTNAITKGQAQSTQDLAFTLLALGKAARGQEKSNINVDIYSNGKILKSSHNADVNLSTAEFKFSSLSMKAGGSGLSYYYFTIDGITKSKAIDADNNLKVRREYLDYNTRKPVNLNNIKQGQILTCKIIITSPAQRVDNISITNLLPACFEIENPRLPEVQRAVAQSPNQMLVRNMDIRDDRLTLFTDMPASSTKEYSFLVRVVNRGNYTVPPVSAEAMYAPSDYRSVFGNSYLSIK